MASVILNEMKRAVAAGERDFNADDIRVRPPTRKTTA